MPEPTSLSVREAAREIAARRLSAEDYAKAWLERVAAREPAVGAWRYLDRDQMLEAARRCDNEPPRGPLQLNAAGEPLYGERDVVDLAKMRELGLPFWLAGGTGSPNALRAALEAGAAGVQVGTLFAYCAESGLDAAVKSRVLDGLASGTVALRTDPRASPTGYPFKIVELPGDAVQSSTRERICDLGYLRIAVRANDGRTMYRCASEPVDLFVSKGGEQADTEGRRCLCNGLLASIGQPQWRAATDANEPTLITSGDDLLSMGGFASSHPNYTARDVVEYLLG